MSGAPTRVVAAAAGLLLAWSVGVVTPAPVAVAGPGQFPCPSVPAAAAGRSVLAVLDAGAVIAPALLTTHHAVAYAGVPALGVRAFAVDAGDAAGFIAALRRAPGVTWAGRDRVLTTMRKPHDPLLRLQWALHKVRAAAAWSVEIGVSAPVTVAVLDTGVDGTHPDLVGRVLPGLDVVDADTDASDEQFHGTAVSSVIAANTDDREGMAGLSWGAQILPVRVLDSSGAGTECDIAAGMVYAADNAKVLNLSLGAATPCTMVMARGVDYAVQQGALVIASSGNSAQKGNPPAEPADCPGAVGVGATDRHDHIAPFSEHGPQVALTAPGVQVLAALHRRHGGHGWAEFDGTSLSAPMVSGVAALLLSRHPDWTSDQVTHRLEHTAVDLGRPGRDPFFGYGRVDAARALS